MNRTDTLQRVWRLWICAMFVAVVFSAQAATYFVDFDGGSDGNTGLSTAAAWKHAPGDENATGNPAGVTLGAGDRVVFKGGVVYYGMIQLDPGDSGAEGSRVVLDGNADGSWGTGRAIIDGGGRTMGRDARVYGVWGRTQRQLDGSNLAPSHVLVDHFKIQNLRYIYGEVSASVERGILFQGPARDVEIRNCHIEPCVTPIAVFRRGRLGVTPNPGTNATTSQFVDTTQDLSAFATTPGSGIAAHKILIGWNNNDYEKAWAYIGTVSGGTMNIYKDLDLTVPGWNVDMGTPTGHTDQYFYRIFNMQQGAWSRNMGSAIQTAGVSDVKIHDNILRRGKILMLTGSASGIPVENIHIYNNDLSECSWGIQSSGGSVSTNRGVRIYGNKFHDFYPFVVDNWGWHSDGIFLWGDLSASGPGVIDAEINNNIFYGDFRPGVSALLFAKYDMEDIRIFNNVFATSTGEGYQLRMSRGPIRNLQIYNNVFAAVPGDEMNSVNIIECDDVHMRNNIFWGFDEYASLFSFSLQETVTFSSDYNLLYSFSPAAADMYYTGAPYSMYAGERYTYWTGSTGNDTHSLLDVDPKFRNFPLFSARVISEGSTTMVYYEPPPTYFPVQSFEVGDYLEYNYDGIPRQVVSVDAASNGIEITPALDAPSGPGDRLQNWGASSNFTVDLRLQPDSPAIDMGADGSTVVSSLDINGLVRPQGTAWDIGPYEFPVGNDTESPTPPTSLQARTVSHEQVDLNWTASDDLFGIAGYDIYVNGSRHGSAQGTFYSATGLNPASSYAFKVRAFDAAGNYSSDSEPASATTQDPPPPEISVADASVYETDTGYRLANFEVELNVAIGQDVTFTATTSNGSATAGLDYEALSASFRIPAGERSVPVAVPVLGDTLQEASETFTLTLSGATNAAIGDGSGEGTIRDNDAASAIPQDGLVAWWPMEGDAAVALGTGPDGALQNGATFATGRVGAALQLDGVDDYVSLGTSNLGLVGGMGVSFWIRPEGSGSTTQNVFLRSVYLRPFAIWLEKPSNQIRVGLRTGNGTHYLTSNALLGGGQWTHIAITYTSGEARIYVNGYVDSVSNTPTGNLYQTATESVGLGGLASGTNFEGLLDEVLLYNRALTDAEALFLYAEAGAPSSPDDETAPSAPSGLAAGTETGGLRLNWSPASDNVGVAGYVVERDGAQIASTANASFLDNTAAESITYAYRIAAFDAAGNASAFSSALQASLSGTITPPPADDPPAAPAGLNATANQQAVQLNWNNNTETDLAGYNLYRATNANGAFAKVNASLLTTNAYQDSGLTANTTYYYQVKAQDQAGQQSDPSTTASATPTAPPPAPDPPTVSVTGGSVTEGDNGQVSLNCTITLSKTWDQTVSVNVSTQDGTATTADADYSALSTQVNIASGITQQTVPIAVISDTIVEPNETFAITLSNATNATIATASANCTIVNDDEETATEEPTPAGQWDLEDGTGTTATDSAGSNDGILNNGPAWTTGRVGTALDFDGTDDFINLGDNNFGLTEAIAFAFWMQPDTGNTSDQYVLLRSFYVRPFRVAWRPTLGTVQVGIRTNGGTSYLSTPENSVTPGEWVHVAFSYQADTSTMEIYLNGQSVASTTHSSGGNLYQISAVTTIGGTTSSGSFAGKIDQIRLYATALSASDVQTIYTGAGQAPIEEDTTPPAAPTGLVASGGHMTVNLTWTANSESDLSHYNIYRSAQSNTGYIQINAQPVAGTSYSDTSANLGQTWFYTLRASDTNGNISGYSNEASATPLDTEPPSPPADLSAQPQ